MVKVANDPTLSTWHRWFRRTNVHIAEYILMLVMMGSFLGLLASLWYSFFGLMADAEYTARTLAMATSIQLGTLLVVAPAAFWLYARVTGQEMVEPGLQQKRARTVFLTLWMLGAVLALVGVTVSVASNVSSAVFGFGGKDVGELVVGTVLPGLFVVATFGFGLFVVVRHAKRKLSMLAGIVLAALSVFLLVANVTMVLVRKDVKAPVRPSCNFSSYLKADCSYEDYRKNSGVMNPSSVYDNKDSSPSTRGLENMFTPSAR